LMREIKEPIMPGLKQNMGNWNSRLPKFGNGIFKALETIDSNSLLTPILLFL
jgi:hypothetical protein